MSAHSDAKSRSGGGIFDGIKEVLHGSGHAAVDGDRVADNVDADLYGSTLSEHYWPHEVDFVPRRVRWDTESHGRSKGGLEEHGFGKGQGEVGKREGEGKRRRFVTI